MSVLNFLKCDWRIDANPRAIAAIYGDGDSTGSASKQAEWDAEPPITENCLRAE